MSLNLILSIVGRVSRGSVFNCIVKDWPEEARLACWFIFHLWLCFLCLAEWMGVGGRKGTGLILPVWFWERRGDDRVFYYFLEKGLKEWSTRGMLWCVCVRERETEIETGRIGLEKRCKGRQRGALNIWTVWILWQEGRRSLGQVLLALTASTLLGDRYERHLAHEVWFGWAGEGRIP